MTPLLVAGATTVAKYLASRAQTHTSALPLSGSTPTKDFSSVLRAALGPEPAGMSAESQARTLEKQLLESPELKSAMSSLPRGSISSIQIKSDGTVSLVHPNGSAEVQIRPEMQNVAKQVFAAAAKAVPTAPYMTSNGLAAVSLEVTAARVG